MTVLDSIRRIFDTDGFPPRWLCGTVWKQEPFWGWLLILSDLAVWGAYLAIPILLIYFLRKRPDLPLPRILWLFVAFIFACGTTHLIDATLFWWPAYRLSGIVKFFTAAVSWMTVAALIPLIPKMLTFHSPAQLENEVTERTEELQRLANKLRQEAREREAVTAKLEEQETRLRLALEAGRMGTWDWNLETNEIIIDSIEEQLLGMKAVNGVIHLEDFLTRVEPADVDQLNAILRKVVKEQTVYDHQFRYHITPSQVRWIAGRGEAIRDENGQTVRLRGINFDITDFKIINTQLSDSQKFLQSVLDSSADGIKVLDREGYLIAANKSGLHALELEGIEDIQGVYWPSLWPKAIRHEVEEALNIARHAGIAHVQGERPTAKGTQRFWDVVITPIEGTGKQVDRILCISRDITDRKKADVALRDSEDRFRTMADNIDQFAWMTDEQGNIVWYNQRWFDYTGTNYEEMQGWGWRKIHHPDHLDRVVAKLTRCFETGTYWEDTFPIRSKSGEYRWFLSRARPIRNADGNVIRWFGTNTDVTDQMSTENELRVRTRAIEFATNGILITDAHLPDNPILYVNPAFQALTGYALEEVEGKNCRILQGRKTDPRHVALLRQAIERKEECHVTILNYTKDGRPFWNDLHVSPIQDEQGAVTHFVGVQMDITPRIRYEKRLEEAQIAANSANRAKSEFLANMSHEIRTPLTAILGCAESLYRQLEDPDPRDAVRMIRDQGELLLGILNDILDLSKIEAGKLEIHKEPSELFKIVGDVNSLMNPQAIERGLDIRVRYLSKIPDKIVTDPLRLRQILLNLVSNAVKFTEMGWIEISVACDQDSQGTNLILTVTDTGIGIAPNRLTSIFDAFTQEKNARSTTVPGTGLGLTICQKLTNMLGGSISVTSNVGKGSRFTVRIPLGEIDASSLHNATELQDYASRRDSQGVMDQFIPCRVLIAEDTRGIQFMMTRMLQDVVAGISLADNGDAAVKSVQQALQENNPFDIVLMDMQMPVMNGFDATVKLRQLGIQTPVIALTAGAMAGDREKCLSVGCTDYLSKPVNRDDVIAILKKYCSSS